MGLESPEKFRHKGPESDTGLEYRESDTARDARLAREAEKDFEAGMKAHQGIEAQQRQAQSAAEKAQQQQGRTTTAEGKDKSAAEKLLSDTLGVKAPEDMEAMSGAAIEDSTLMSGAEKNLVRKTSNETEAERIKHEHAEKQKTP
ncbi:hypothetical protein H6771_02505 [Candidatus Peribacteria bacterium]|nr:hypothetical protein [Candidatus Peribacteria bacterium]